MITINLAFFALPLLELRMIIGRDVVTRMQIYVMMMDDNYKLYVRRPFLYRVCDLVVRNVLSHNTFLTTSSKYKGCINNKDKVRIRGRGNRGISVVSRRCFVELYNTGMLMLKTKFVAQNWRSD
jgi:hypothetical protein